MKMIPISEAEAKDLRYHAKTVLGLDGITNMMNRTTLISKIEAAAPGTTEVQVAEDPASMAQAEAEKRESVIKSTPVIPPARAAAPTGMSAKEAAQYRYDPQVKVYIPSVAGPGGDRHVDVAVNGHVVRIKRNEWVPVPFRFFGALKDAVASELTPVNDHEGKMTIESRDVQSYPFQVDMTTYPSPEEIAEWEERVGKVELA